MCKAWWKSPAPDLLRRINGRAATGRLSAASAAVMNSRPAQQHHLWSYVVIMTKKGYAIRSTSNDKSNLEAALHEDLAECLGEDFADLTLDNPEAGQYVLRGIPSKMGAAQIANAFVDASCWRVRPIRRLGKERLESKANKTIGWRCRCTNLAAPSSDLRMDMTSVLSM